MALADDLTVLPGCLFLVLSGARQRRRSFQAVVSP